MKRIAILLSLLIILKLSGCVAGRFNPVIADEPSPSPTQIAQPPARLFDNLGNHRHPISTRVPLAQRYFNQGLILAYGFNHAEAVLSFQEAAKLDPNCAMCYWGIALALGPNINAPMKAEAVPQAWEALQKAIALSKTASKPEQDYIQALTKRYSPQPVADRSSLNRAYANAMRELAQRYPNDADAATLFAESLMNITPWQYWESNGNPKPEGKEMMATLESVLQRNPNHPGANHFYVHTVEERRPDLGIQAANRLTHLVPGAGHLLHMPSHIYITIGRYHDIVEANQRAIAADLDYLSQAQVGEDALGLFRIGYLGHNSSFLWFTAMMTGESKVAIQAARDTAMLVDAKSLNQPGQDTMQRFYSLPLYAWAKFGQWDEILQASAPDAELLYPTGVWHYARGMAFKAKGQLNNAKQELEQLQTLIANSVSEKASIGEINQKILNTASNVLAGELAAKQKNYESAIAHLQTAIELDDSLKNDPPFWYSPVRQTLGAVLLEAGRPAEAEQVYQEDLKMYLDNGWSLLGLAQSLKAQGKTSEAKSVQKRFKQAWKHADVKLVASRF
jgi:tetratricopeptide (TPR) repeat protein